MAKLTVLYESFNAGELSPLLEGRVDYAKYKKGLKSCVNFLPTVQGPLVRRPGSRRAWNTKDSVAAILLEFEFSTTQAYILEVGDQYIRFYKDHALITLTGQTVLGVTKANPAVLTYDGADTYANGDRVALTGLGGMTELNNREFTVANVNAGANTFELSGVNSTGYTTFTSGGTVSEIYELSTPYVAAHLSELVVAQSADVLYIAHPSYAPRKLSRTGHTSWTLTTIDFKDGPYLATNTSTTTITPSATTGSGITLTASAATFASTDVGRLVRIKHSSTWGYAKITAYTSTTVVTADVKSNFGASTASADWRLGTWSDTTGYPAAVTFYGDRLFWGTTQRVDGSVVGDYENYAPSNTSGTVADDNAVAFSLNANDVNIIRWLMDDEKGLVAGTAGGEWLIRASNANEALTPTNIKADRSTTIGVARIMPARAGKGILFAQKSKRSVHELAYVFEDDGLRSPDMSTVSEHILRGGVVDLAYQAEPQSVLWCVRADGVLVGFTYEREQEVLAWHRHTLGGSFGSGSAVVEGVASIPTPTGDADEVWVVVKRTINSATVRTVEYLDSLWDDSRDQEDAFFIDCGATYDSSPTTTISGLNWLEGQTVTVLADGGSHPDRTVSAGAITLGRSASVVQVGLGYRSSAHTMRVEAGAQAGTAQGKIKRIGRIVVRLWQSLGDLKFGPKSDAANLEQVVFREFGDDAGTPPPLFDGDYPLNNTGGYETEGRIYFQVNQPFPVNILALMAEIRTEER